MPENPALTDVLAAVQTAGTKYEVLGVLPEATENEIRIALRRLALLYHPDRQAEQDREIAHQIFCEVSAAYRVLIDPEERAAYDRALASGGTYRESSEQSEGMSLRDILDEMQCYEHVFSESRLTSVDMHLRDAVVASLIDEFGEQIVAVYRMTAPPTGASMKGTYKTGAVVVTNLRVLLPFSYQWEESDGNQRTTYTRLSMPSFPMHAVTNFRIEQRGGLFKPETILRIQTEDGNTEVKPSEADLAKILIVARLWAIQVEAVAVVKPAADYRRALIGPFSKAALWVAGVLAASLALGIFVGGFIDNPAWVVTTADRYGIWHGLVWLCSVASARRVRRCVLAYRILPVTTLLQKSADRPADPVQAASVAM